MTGLFTNFPMVVFNMTQIALEENGPGIDEGDILMSQPTPQSGNSVVAPIVSAHVKEIFDIMNYVTISAAIGVFGICANVINITVFVKQGFRDVITISLLALAVSDLLALVAMELYDVFVNPYVRSADLPFEPEEIQYVLASWPHSCFTRITCLVTAFVAFERCLCIVFPLKVKTILTPARASVAVFSIFACVFVSVIPAYMTVELTWRFDSVGNRTVLGIEMKPDVKRVADIAFVVNCVMQFLAFGSVVVSTSVLVTKLKAQSKWRNSSSSSSSSSKNENQSRAISDKDMKLIRMIILISVILILCCTPGSSCFIAALFVPEFSPNGSYRNIYYVSWSFAYVTDAINPSVNIFLYYNMSSRYRATFRHLCPVCFKGNQMFAGDASAGSSAYNVYSETTKKCNSQLN